MSAKRLVFALVLALMGLASCIGNDGTFNEGEVEQANHAPAPQNLAGFVLSSTRVRIEWDAVPNADKYIILWGASPGNMTNSSSYPASSTSYETGHMQPGETRCFQVQSVVGGHRSASSNEVCLTTSGAPPPPSDLVATATSSTRIQLTWSAVSSATFYRIYQSLTATGGYSLIGTIQATSTPSFIATGLQPNTTYYFRVSTVYDGGESAQSDPPASATTFIAGLEAFWRLDEETGSTAIDSSGFGRNGTVSAAYSTADKAPIDFNRSALSFSGATSSAVDVPHASVFNFGGDFALTTWVRVPTAPGGTLRLIGKRAAGCGATTWELAQDASGLHFRGGSGTYGFGQSLPVGEWTHVGVTAEGDMLTLYINGQSVATHTGYSSGAQVNAPLQLGNSGSCGSGGSFLLDDIRVYSRALTGAEVATFGDRPEPPTNFTGVALSPTKIRLTWDAVPGATKYFVFKGTGAGTSTFFTSTDANDAMYEFGHLQPNETTSWQIAVIVNGLISERTGEVVITTPPPPDAPTNVVATAVSSSRINLSWSPAANAGKYYVYQSINGGAFAFKGTATATASPTFAATGLAANTLHTYVIRTVDVRDNKTQSADSAPASATTFP